MNAQEYKAIFEKINADHPADAVPFNDVDYYAEQIHNMSDETLDWDECVAIAEEMNVPTCGQIKEFLETFECISSITINSDNTMSFNAHAMFSYRVDLMLDGRKIHEKIDLLEGETYVSFDAFKTFMDENFKG